jgi:ElaA protein
MLMRQALRFMGQYYPFEDVVISAQKYLENFYTSFGFVTESEPYDEDGIPHVQMRWKEEF